MEEAGGDSTQLVEAFQQRSASLLDAQFPTKTVLVGSNDQPYFTEELRLMKRQRKRAYKRHGAKSIQYKTSKQKFEDNLEHACVKYRQKIEDEVRQGVRGSGYSAIRKLGQRPGEEANQEFTVHTHAEAGLTAEQSAERLADHFSMISQSVEELVEDRLPPALRLALQDGRREEDKPVLTQHDVYRKIKSSKKPHSSVGCDVPRKLMVEFAYEYAEPAARIFNSIIATTKYPRQWVVEEQVPIPKTSPSMVVDEDQVRNISKTPFLSKVMESIMLDWLLPIVEPYWDPMQCGGLKGSSITHYLVRLLDFIHAEVDKMQPHAVILDALDLSKAFNRGSHSLVLADLHAMHVPNWLLALLASYLTGRSMVINYKGVTSSRRILPGGFGQGTSLGGFLFLIKFNGACLRPPVPRPVSGNKALQVKFVDDVSQVASINMKASLVPDTAARPRPLKYDERTSMILPNEENLLQQQVNSFQTFVAQNKLMANTKKCKTMKFNFSKKHDFPLEIIMGQEVLDEVNQMKILGVIISSDLKWQNNTEYIVKKAMSKIWVLRRMKQMGVGEKTLTDYWAKEGRAVLELAVPSWHSGLTGRQTAAIERCQRVAVAAISNCGWQDYDATLARLGLCRLAERREKLCRTFATRTVAKSRHADIFPRREHGHNTRRGGNAFREDICRIQRRHKSARPYLARLLNK